MGIIGTDAKRPFGNSDIIGDMAEITGIGLVETDDGPVLPLGASETLEMIFKDEIPVAMQIILRCKSFKTGVYECTKYMQDWRFVDDVA